MESVHGGLKTMHRATQNTTPSSTSDRQKCCRKNNGLLWLGRRHDCSGTDVVRGRAAISGCCYPKPNDFFLSITPLSCCTHPKNSPHPPPPPSTLHTKNKESGAHPVGPHLIVPDHDPGPAVEHVVGVDHPPRQRADDPPPLVHPVHHHPDPPHLPPPTL